MPEFSNPIICFGSGEAANYRVAGIPAAARAVAILAQEGDSDAIRIAVPGNWQPDEQCRSEIERLAPGLKVKCVDSNEFQTGSIEERIGGADLIAAELPPMRAPVNDELLRLRQMGRAIIRATGKAGDGIVSRHLNRPISQAISRLLLTFDWVRPGYATFATALVAMAMFASLLWGGTQGLITGALLFQLASIVDGVDGELARATFRSSASGAMWDSLTDAATNLAFILGVTINLWLRGFENAAFAGLFGFAFLACGMAILGIRSRLDGGDFTFDALKHRVREKPSQFRQWLIWLTQRDFYALAACIAVIVGFAAPLLYVFSVVTAIWLMMAISLILKPNKETG